MTTTTAAVATQDPGEDKSRGRQAPSLTHSQSVNRLHEITAELERLQELDVLSPQDETYFEDLAKEFTTVDEHRKRLEREFALEKLRGAVKGAHGSNLRLERGTPQQRTTGSGDGYDLDAIREPDSVEDRRFKDPWNLSEVRTFGRSREDLNAEYTARALSAIESMPFANDRIREVGTQIVERWDDKHGTLAQQVLLSSSPAYIRAWSKMATNQPHLLKPEEQRALDQVRAMSLTDSAGGYLVPFQLDPTVIITANGSLNDIRRVARRVIATGDVWNGTTAGAVSWSWDAEATQVSDDAPSFGQPQIPVYKANGFVPISIEAIEDAANVGAVVGELLAEGREVLESAALVIGSGTGQPTGIVTALTGTASEVAAATADTFALADVYALQGALPARYRRNASWLSNNLIYNRIRQFDTSGGNALWAQLGEDRPANLLNRAALEAEDMDGVINATQNNFVLIFGDFSNYVIADRIGMTVEFIPHLFQQTTAGSGFGRPTGQRGWYAYYRVGADSVNDAAFRMLNV